MIDIIPQSETVPISICRATSNGCLVYGQQVAQAAVVYLLGIYGTEERPREVESEIKSLMFMSKGVYEMPKR